MENSTFSIQTPNKGLIHNRFGVYLLVCMAVFISNLSNSQLFAQINPLDTGMVAHYGFNENDGQVVADLSKNHFDGYIVGDVNWVPGKFGSSVEFMGTNDSHVEVPESVLGSGLIFDVTDSWSLSLWIKLPAIPTVWTTIVAKSRDQGGHFGLWLAPNGSESWTYGGWPNFGGVITNDHIDTWTHLVVVQNGDYASITGYMNGVEDFVGSVPRPLTGAGDLWMGGGKSVKEWLIGSIDDVRIYNRALSAEDVAALYIYASLPVSVKSPLDDSKSSILNQNYSNPFNLNTNISYNLQKKAEVKIVVYDMLGQQVAMLVNEVRPAGQNNVQLDGRKLNGGVYIYKMNLGNQVFTRKMQLVK